MSPETLFKLTCLLAGIGWIILIFVSPFWAWYDKFLIGIIIVILAFTYTYLNFTNTDPDILRKFSSLDGVANLFQNKSLLLAGWIHIMAFDLIGAVWMKRNSVTNGINHWIMAPVILFTCALGPLGFLLYLIIRSLKTRRYFADNTA